VLGAGVVALGVAVPLHRAQAQGFGLNEVGTCSVGRGFAVSAATCHDGSEIFWNPAAAALLPGTTLSIGAAAINVSGGFRQDTTLIRYPSNLRTAIAPQIFLNAKLSDETAVGIGVYVPYGLTSQWYGNFPGRFSALKASLNTVYIQPNIAYALNPQWSIGGGPIIGVSTVHLVQSIDLSSQVAAVQNGVPITFGQLGIASGTEFARADVKGHDVAYGFNVGIHGTFAKDWAVGVRYLSELHFKYDNAKAKFQQIATGLTLASGNPIVPGGAAAPLDAVLAPQFTGTNPLTSQSASTNIDHPWQVQGGIGYTGFVGTTLSADVARMGWSSFKTLPITFGGPAAASNRALLEDYHDIWSYRFGAEHIVQGNNAFHGVAFRGGFSYAQTPAPDETVSPLLPDMPRRNTSIGIGVPLTDAVRIEGSYLYVNTAGRRGRIAERTSASQTAAQLNSGAYDLKANVFSLSLVTHF